MNSASVGDTIKYAGLTLVVDKILQPYDLAGNMLMPIVELIDVADDSVWGYLDLPSVWKLKKQQEDKS